MLLMLLIGWTVLLPALIVAGLYVGATILGRRRVALRAYEELFADEPRIDDPRTRMDDPLARMPHPSASPGTPRTPHGRPRRPIAPPTPRPRRAGVGH